MTRRGFLAYCTVVAGTLLTGCLQRKNGAKVTLRQWYHEYGQAGTEDAVLRYALEYTAQNPGIAIEIVWTPGDYGTKLATALLTSEGPDIFEGQLTSPMVGAGQVAPLDDLFPPKIRSDFLPQDLAMNTVGGKIYGVKSMDDIEILYYRPSILKKAGVSVPSTSQELLEAIQKLTNSTTKGLYLGEDGGISAMLNILPWSAGSDFLVDNQIVFDTQNTASAYAFLRTMNTNGSLLLGAPTDWWEPSALIQGMAAMQWSGLWAYPQIKAAVGDDLGIAPWPAFTPNDEPAAFLGGWSTMVNGQSSNIEEAKKYVKWLWIDNTAAQRDWCLGYGFHLPPRKSVAQTAEPLKKPPVDLAVKAVNEHGHFMPPEWTASMNTALTDAVTNIVKLGADPSSELAIAKTKCDRELARNLE